jgi:hypothetical protein
MKRFTDAGREALAQNNLYAALTLALMLPDICGSLEDPGPGKAHKRYTKWFDDWGPEDLNGYVSAEDCFQLRCSLIHSGSAEIEETKRNGIDKFEFLSAPNAAHLVRMSGNTMNGVPQPSVVVLNTRSFCESFYKAADNWDASKAEDPAMKKAKDSLLIVKPAGTTMQGIQFG